jgi:hypothetical protein
MGDGGEQYWMDSEFLLTPRVELMEDLDPCRVVPARGYRTFIEVIGPPVSGILAHLDSVLLLLLALASSRAMLTAM